MAAMTLRANQQHSSYLLFRSQIHSFRRSIVGVYFFIIIIIIIIIVKTILTGFLRLYLTLRPFYHVIFDGKISLYCKPLICPSRDLSISDFTTCQILSYYLPMVCFFYQNCCFLCFQLENMEALNALRILTAHHILSANMKNANVELVSSEMEERVSLVRRLIPINNLRNSKKKYVSFLGNKFSLGEKS